MVTLRKRNAALETRLNEQANHLHVLHALVEQAPDGIGIAAPDGTLEYANPALRQLLGCKEQLPAIDAWYLPHERQHHTARLQQAFAYTPWQGQLTYQRTDGSTFSGQTWHIPICNTAGQPQALGMLVRDVTEATERDTLLGQLEGEWRKASRAVEQSPSAIVITDTKGTIEYVNPKFCQVTGYSYEEVIGQNPRVLKSGERSAAEYRELWQTITSGQEWRGEFHNRRKNGELFWEFASISPVFSPEGDITHFLAVKEDITERKMAEEALRQSEEMYRLLAQNATDMISRHAPDGSYLYVSPACTTLLGYVPEDVIGQDSYRFIHPADIPLITASHTANLLAHRTSRVTYRIRRKDGQYIWFETDARVILDTEQESVVEIIAVSRDVTERTRIAQELEQSLGLLKATLESVANGIMAVDLDGEVMHYNQRFEQLWHLPAAWYTLPSHQERLALLTRQICEPHAFQQRIIHLMQHPEENGYDIIALNDGRIIERYGTPYRMGQSIAGRVWSFLDVTERKRAEAELWASRARLQAIFDNAAVGVCLLDKDGYFIEFNECWVEFFGYSAAELPHLTYLNITPFDEHPSSAERFEHLVNGTVSSYRLEKQYQRKDGSLFWGDTSVTTVCNAQGEIEGISAVVADITERRASQEALQHANGKLILWVNELEQRNYEMGLLNDLGEQLQVCQTVDEAYRVAAQFLAQLFQQYTGALYIFDETRTTASQVAAWGTTTSAWQHTCEPARCHALHEKTDYMTATRADLPCCCGQNTLDWLVTCVPLVAQNETLGVLRIAEDTPDPTCPAQRWQQLGVTVAHHLALSLANIHLRDRLREQAILDQLTGLFNRRYLDEALEREVIRAIRQQQPLGLIMLDIDHFKNFNTTYGHGGGDVILRTVGEFLRNNVRAEDIACRYGGEEFMLILPTASLLDTQRRAEELRRGIERITAFFNGEQLGRITVSLGVASFPTHGENAWTVVEAASQALRGAKAQGRNRVVQANIDSSYAV